MALGGGEDLLLDDGGDLLCAGHGGVVGVARYYVLGAVE